MKTLVLIAMLANLPLQSATQQRESPILTSGFPNGRAWIGFSDVGKIAYVYGFMDGANAFQLQLGQQPALKPFDDTIWKAKEPLLTKALAGEVIAQIDMIYDDSANVRIPIVFAYVHALKRIKGASAAELERDLAALRRNVNQ